MPCNAVTPRSRRTGALRSPGSRERTQVAAQSRCRTATTDCNPPHRRAVPACTGTPRPSRHNGRSSRSDRHRNARQQRTPHTCILGSGRHRHSRSRHRIVSGGTCRMWTDSSSPRDSRLRPHTSSCNHRSGCSSDPVGSPGRNSIGTVCTLRQTSIPLHTLHTKEQDTTSCGPQLRSIHVPLARPSPSIARQRADPKLQGWRLRAAARCRQPAPQNGYSSSPGSMSS